MAAADKSVSDINHSQIGSLNVFCIRMPVIRPAATNNRGAVFMTLLLESVKYPPANCRSIKFNFRCMSSTPPIGYIANRQNSRIFWRRRCGGQLAKWLDTAFPVIYDLADIGN